MSWDKGKMCLVSVLVVATFGGEVGGREGLTLNSWDIMGSSSQYRAIMTFAWAVTDCGSWRSRPAAWVRHWVEKKMASCSSVGSALKERRW